MPRILPRTRALEVTENRAPMRARRTLTRRMSAIEVIEVHARPVDRRRGLALVVGLAHAVRRGPDLAGLGEHLAAVLQPIPHGRLAPRLLHPGDLGIRDLVELLDAGLHAVDQLHDDERAVVAGVDLLGEV